MKIHSMYGVPEGYIIGLVRDPLPTNYHTSHLYKGTHSEPGLPMCRNGWNRKEYGYSIWRGQVGNVGICKTCLRRAKQGLEGVECPYGD